MANTMNARQIMKRTATASTIPTIPSSSDHTDGTWLATDIYKGEMFYNEANDSLWTRGTNGIVHLGGRAKLVIPSAQVLTLNSVPVAFGLTVPSGYYTQVLGASASIVYNSAAYATNTQLQLTNGGAAALGTIGSNFLASTVSKTTTSYSPENPTAGQTQVLSATDVFVIVRTGDPTAGDSDITVYLTYVLIKI
jgi:hypothetical protein